MDAHAEIEALLSIFGDELCVESKPDRSLTCVRKKVRPNDEEGVSSASIVVEFELGPEYPEKPPKVQLLNPRGISEQSQHQLTKQVEKRLSENQGIPVMFDILQHCADFILEHQHSSSLACPICLCPMASGSVSSTSCDHFAHTECLEQHVEHTRKQLGEKLAARGFKMCDDLDRSLRCPVCRIVMEERVEPILQPSPPAGRRRRSSFKEREVAPSRRHVQQGSHVDFDFDWERWRQQQAALMVIYEKQKEKGGIIDLDEERKKNLITEDTVIFLGDELDSLTVNRPPFSVDQLPATATSLDAPPGFEGISQAQSAPQTIHQVKGRSNRGRERATRFLDSHHGKRGRGGVRRGSHNDSLAQHSMKLIEKNYYLYPSTYNI
ncbi:hypothetical protein Q1695_013697 [Nippostrongylus brasiliensis]|nr:hypothetical protein Q1695_013697 [Nippostrongylus brasiliensis]